MVDSLQHEIDRLHAQICQALADPKRILILYALAEGPRRVTDLVEALGIPQPTLSNHLKTLRDRGLVIAEREGASVYYSLADRRVIEALDMLRAVLVDISIRQASLVQSGNVSQQP